MAYSTLNELTNKLVTWVKVKRNEIFVIDGPSQIGKTFFIQNFMKHHHLNHIYIDVKINKELIERLLNDTYITGENFYSSLCFHFGRQMSPYLTQLVFDNIEFCPLLRQFFKTLVKFDQINIIAISCGGLGASHYKNLLVPSEENINHIFPMSFKDFMREIGQETLESHLFSSIVNKKPISEFLSTEVFKFFKLYNIIGGYPSVVKTYIARKDIVTCKKMNQEILIKQFDHAKELLNDGDKQIMDSIAKNIFSIITKGTYSSLESISIFKMKQLLSFLEDEYVITMPTALDMTDTSKQSNAKRLYFFHQCFYHATNDSFENNNYFNGVYPTETEVLTDFFFNQRRKSKPFRYGVYRKGKYIETDALLFVNMNVYDIEFKTRRLSNNNIDNFFEKINGVVKPGIYLFNGNVFEYGRYTVLPSFCSCYLNDYIDTIIGSNNFAH